jgi:hypothetical protein
MHDPACASNYSLSQVTLSLHSNSFVRFYDEFPCSHQTDKAAGKVFFLLARGLSCRHCGLVNQELTVDRSAKVCVFQ